MRSGCTDVRGRKARHGEPGTVHIYQADLACVSDCEGFVEWAASQMGGLDVLVSNVSAMNTDFQDCAEIDIIGVQALMRAALAVMPDHAELTSFVFHREQPQLGFLICNLTPQ